MADVTVTLTGVVATGALNFANPITAVEGVLFGMSAFGEAGSSPATYVDQNAVTGEAIVEVTGVLANGFIVGVDIPTYIAGLEATAALGTTTLDLQTNINASKVWASAILTGVEVQTDVVVTLDGVSGQVPVGGVDVPIYVTGVSANTYVNINLFPMSEGTLLGFSAFDELNTQTSYVRPLVVTADGVVNALNVSGTGAVGSVTIRAEAVVNVSGVYGTGLTHDVEIPTHVAGVYGTGAVGSVDISADANADVFSIYATGIVGSVDVAADANIDAIGVYGTGQAGLVDVPTYVTGVYSAGAVGSVDISADANVIPLGVFATGQVKSVRLWSNVDNAVATNWVDIAA